jgi:hypothetical protein
MQKAGSAFTLLKYKKKGLDSLLKRGLTSGWFLL